MIQGRKLSQHEVLYTAGSFWETALTTPQSFLPREWEDEVVNSHPSLVTGYSRGDTDSLVLLTCPMHGQQSGGAQSELEW